MPGSPWDSFCPDVLKIVIDKILLALAGGVIAYRFAIGLETHKAKLAHQAAHEKDKTTAALETWEAIRRFELAATLAATKPDQEAMLRKADEAGKLGQEAVILITKTAPLIDNSALTERMKALNHALHELLGLVVANNPDREKIAELISETQRLHAEGELRLTIYARGTL